MPSPSEWTGYVQAVTPLDPAGGDVTASAWSGYVTATVADLPGNEWWVADGAWRPAKMRALSG